MSSVGLCVDVFWNSPVYLESLLSMLHFPVNPVEELELSQNFAKQQVQAWGRFFLQ